MATSNARGWLPMGANISSLSRIWEGAHRSMHHWFYQQLCDSSSIRLLFEGNENKFRSTPQGASHRGLRHFVQQKGLCGAERFWSPTYIQHSAHISPGREGLFGLIKSLPATLKYEHELIIAEGDYVIAHVRFFRTRAS